MIMLLSNTFMCITWITLQGQHGWIEIWFVIPCLVVAEGGIDTHFLCICLVKERKGKGNRENSYFRYFVCKEKGKKIILCFSLIKKKNAHWLFFPFLLCIFHFLMSTKQRKTVCHKNYIHSLHLSLNPNKV